MDEPFLVFMSKNILAWFIAIWAKVIDSSQLLFLKSWTHSPASSVPIQICSFANPLSLISRVFFYSTMWQNAFDPPLSWDFWISHLRCCLASLRLSDSLSLSLSLHNLSLTFSLLLEGYIVLFYLPQQEAGRKKKQKQHSGFTRISILADLSALAN